MRKEELVKEVAGIANYYFEDAEEIEEHLVMVRDNKDYSEETLIMTESDYDRAMSLGALFMDIANKIRSLEPEGEA